MKAFLQIKQYKAGVEKDFYFAFKFKSEEQYQSWHDELIDIQNRCGKGYRDWFDGVDGSLDFGNIYDTLTEAIETGCMSFGDFTALKPSEAPRVSNHALMGVTSGNLD